MIVNFHFFVTSTHPNAFTYKVESINHKQVFTLSIEYGIDDCYAMISGELVLISSVLHTYWVVWLLKTLIMIDGFMLTKCLNQEKRETEREYGFGVNEWRADERFQVGTPMDGLLFYQRTAFNAR